MRAAPLASVLMLALLLMGACSGGRSVSLADVSPDALITEADLPAHSWRMTDQRYDAAQIAENGAASTSNVAAACGIYVDALAEPTSALSRGFLATGSAGGQATLSSVSLAIAEYGADTDVAALLGHQRERLSAEDAFQQMLDCIKEAFEAPVAGAPGTPAVAVDSITGGLRAPGGDLGLAYEIELAFHVGSASLTSHYATAIWAEGPLLVSVTTSHAGPGAVEVDAPALAAKVRERLAAVTGG